jgi:hypothetical protein
MSAEGRQEAVMPAASVTTKQQCSEDFILL